jgi:hypothetical protein
MFFFDLKGAPRVIPLETGFSGGKFWVSAKGRHHGLYHTWDFYPPNDVVLMVR